MIERGLGKEAALLLSMLDAKVFDRRKTATERSREAADWSMN
jgi:hypothetical protein